MVPHEKPSEWNPSSRKPAWPHHYTSTTCLREEWAHSRLNNKTDIFVHYLGNPEDVWEDAFWVQNDMFKNFSFKQNKNTWWLFCKQNFIGFLEKRENIKFQTITKEGSGSDNTKIHQQPTKVLTSTSFLSSPVTQEKCLFKTEKSNTWIYFGPQRPAGYDKPACLVIDLELTLSKKPWLAFYLRKNIIPLACSLIFDRWKPNQILFYSLLSFLMNMLFIHALASSMTSHSSSFISLVSLQSLVLFALKCPWCSFLPLQSDF